jgi:hypothetical protein
MSDASRRTFLAAAGTVAAAAATVAVAPRADAAPAHTDDGAPGSGPLVAYIEDASSGSISLMVGESEVVVHDPDLVRRLSRAAGR